MAKKSDPRLTFVKFCLVGALNTGIDYGLFLLLDGIGVQFLVAHCFSYSAGVLNSYFWNKFWTFRTERRYSVREALLFVCVNLFALAISGLVLYSASAGLLLPDAAAKAIALPFSLLTNYLGNRFLVFPKRPAFNKD